MAGRPLHPSAPIPGTARRARSRRLSSLGPRVSTAASRRRGGCMSGSRGLGLCLGSCWPLFFCETWCNMNFGTFTPFAPWDPLACENGLACADTRLRGHGGVCKGTYIYFNKKTLIFLQNFRTRTRAAKGGRKVRKSTVPAYFRRNPAAKGCESGCESPRAHSSPTRTYALPGRPPVDGT